MYVRMYICMVWAPSARELVALEIQVKDMPSQLQQQQQQWHAFFAVRATETLLYKPLP